MSRDRGTIAEEVARVERLREQLAHVPHDEEHAATRRHLRRAIARGRKRVDRMLEAAAR